MNTKKTMKRLKKTEQLLKQCEQDAQRLEAIQKEIKAIENRRKKLESYYESQYMTDIDLALEMQKFGILDEDSIWNVLTSQYQSKIQLLKSIIKSI